MARAAPLGLLLVALALLAACGFEPAYAPGGAGEALRGRVEAQAPATLDGAALARRLEDRLGPAAPGALSLVAEVTIEEVTAAVTPEGAITRYELLGRAPWRLLGAGGAVLAEGTATAFTGYSATGTTVATRAAEADARERLAALLADAVVTRLLALPPGLLGATP